MCARCLRSMPYANNCILDDAVSHLHTLMSTMLCDVIGKLTHRESVTHICGRKLGHNWFKWLSPVWRQDIVLTNAEFLSIEYKGTKFSDILNDIIEKNAFKIIVCKMAAISSRPTCVNTLIRVGHMVTVVVGMVAVDKLGAAIQTQIFRAFSENICCSPTLLSNTIQLHSSYW